ncbi:MAG: restriction endonuclease, partial [Candidatus Bathyarchaeia archaeon]
MDSGVSTRDKGASLEDALAHLFRRLGFRTEVRVKLKDRYGVPHEIDVLAEKAEPFGAIKIAVECKYIGSQVNIREIRNFHSKLTALNLTKGIFASTGGFTEDAKVYAKSLGIELWDSKVLREKMKGVEAGTEHVEDRTSLTLFENSGEIGMKGELEGRDFLGVLREILPPPGKVFTPPMDGTNAIEQRHILIYGGPGSGKTNAFRHIAECLADTYGSRFFHIAYTDADLAGL